MQLEADGCRALCADNTVTFSSCQDDIGLTWPDALLWCLLSVQMESCVSSKVLLSKASVECWSAGNVEIAPAHGTALSSHTRLVSCQEPYFRPIQ